jgi:nucleoid DNA-binding protein
VRKNLNSIEADKVKGVLMTRTAIKTLIPEDIVEKVIMFQFKDLKDNMLEHEQLEVSGFGKFMTSPAKIKRKIDKLEAVLINMEKKIREKPEQIAPSRLAMWDKMTQRTEDVLAFLKTKKGGYAYKPKRDTGGDMELPIREGGSGESSQSEDGDLQGMFNEL